MGSWRRLHRTRRLVTVCGALVAVVAAAAACRPVEETPSTASATPTRPAHAKSTHSVDDTVRGSRSGSSARKATKHVARRFSEVQQTRTATPGADTTLHGTWGATIAPDAATGVIATQSLLPGLRLSDPDDVIYAPTVKPTSHTCVEVTTVYDSGVPHVGAWNWCGPEADKGFEMWVPVDADFLDSYAVDTTGATGSAYTVEVTRTDDATNEWTVYLLNQRTDQWDTMYSSSGSDGGQGDGGGWDMFEIYAKPDPATGRVHLCDDITEQSFESSNVQLYTASGWQAVTPENAPFDPAPDGASEFGCPALSFDAVAPDHWLVTA